MQEELQRERPLIFLRVFAAAMVIGLIACGRPTGDDALVKLFNNNQAMFEKMVRMVLEDQATSRIANEYIRPTGSITPARWEEYRTAFKKVGIEGGIIRWHSTGAIEFVVEASGLATGGWMKGIVFRETLPEKLYDRLDERPADLGSNERGYRRIDEDWYLFYVWDD
jgi:hypothetical protein